MYLYRMKMTWHLLTLLGLLHVTNLTAQNWEYNNPKEQVKGKQGVAVPLNKGVPAAMKHLIPGLVIIPEGTETLGGASADPDSTGSTIQRRVSISRFVISSTEVSNLQYRAFLSAVKKKVDPATYLSLLPDTAAWLKFETSGSYTASYFRSPAYDHYPVVGVNWYQAQEYCKWLTEELMSTEEGKAFAKKNNLMAFRLPTEMEWEYAARGGNKKMLYPWGNGFMAFEKNAYILKANMFPADAKGSPLIERRDFFFTAPVKSYPPNGYGLYNVSGNVSEWTLDVYRPMSVDPDANVFRRVEMEDKYERSASGEPEIMHVYRGGSFDEQPYYGQCAARRYEKPEVATCGIGFRIATGIAGTP
jgi:formylglycine-generating enzyme required for sulfatase activity